METLRRSTPAGLIVLNAPVARWLALVAVGVAVVGCGSAPDRVATRTPRPTPTATPKNGPVPVAPWSSVRRRSVPGKSSTIAAGLSYAPGDGGVVTWGDRTRTGMYAAVGARNAIGIPHELPSDWGFASAPQWASDGTGTVLLTQARRRDEISAMAVATISRTAQLGPIQPLATGKIATAKLAGDAEGNVLVAWTTVDKFLSSDDVGYVPRELTVHAQLHAASAAAGSFTPATTLLRETELTGGALEVAMGGGGHAVVSLTVGPNGVSQKRGARVVAWAGTAAGGLGAKQVLGVRRSDTWMHIAGTPSGLVVVAWGSQAAGEEADSPWVVRAAALAPGDLAFSPTQVVDPGGAVESTEGDIFVVAGQHGTAILAWTSIRQRREPSPIVIASSDATGTFGAPSAVLNRHGRLNGLAADLRTGAMVVTWGTNESGEAILRPSPTAAWGRPEPLAEGFSSDSGPEGDGPQPTFDHDGVPALAYTHASSTGKNQLWIQSRQP